MLLAGGADLEEGDFRDLLPSQLGAPEPTVFDLFGKTDKTRPRKYTSSIQEWVIAMF